MLIINVSQIPPEGLPVHTDLVPSEVHVEGEESFELRPGGRLDAQVERGDEDSVHVRGHVSASVRVQCGRCLEPFDLPVDQDLDLFYLPHRNEVASRESAARSGASPAPRREGSARVARLETRSAKRSAAHPPEEEEDVELSDRDMVVAFYRGSQLDLGHMVREQLFLALPMKRLCREACAGLCPACGINRNTGRCDCPPEAADARLAPLKKLLDRSKS
jgi:uncharacterized metal-binding protein YceD (DUF177 family)